MSSLPQDECELFKIYISGLLSDIKEDTDCPQDTLDHFKEQYDGSFLSFPDKGFTSRYVSVSFNGSTVVAEIDGVTTMKMSKFKSLVDLGKVTLSEHE